MFLTNWIKSVETSLHKLGFDYVWKNGGATNEASFMKCLKQRLRDCYCQEWHGNIGNSERFQMYSAFKSALEPEGYLNHLNIKKIREVFVRFRLRINELSANRGYVKEQRDNMNCPFCRDTTENEEHFLLFCHEYEDLRGKYLKYHVQDAKRILFTSLIDGQNVRKTRNVAMLIYYVLKGYSQLLHVSPVALTWRCMSCLKPGSYVCNTLGLVYSGCLVNVKHGYCNFPLLTSRCAHMFAPTEHKNFKIASVLFDCPNTTHIHL